MLPPMSEVRLDHVQKLGGGIVPIYCYAVNNACCAPFPALGADPTKSLSLLPICICLMQRQSSKGRKREWNHLLRSSSEDCLEDSPLNAEMLREARVLQPLPGENTLGRSLTSVAARSSELSSASDCGLPGMGMAAVGDSLRVCAASA